MSLLTGSGGGGGGGGDGGVRGGGNTAGSGSGLKVAKTWNFGFMAGVKQLRDEEYEDQYKPSLRVPGSSNFVQRARDQFNDDTYGDKASSGYMAEEPGNTPLWRKVPQHLVKLRLPGLLYDGTAKDDPNDDYEPGIAGRWSSKMKAKGRVGKAPLPGYDGAVSGYYQPTGVAEAKGEEDAPEGEHEIAEVEASPAVARARQRAEAGKVVGRAVIQQALKKASGSVASGSTVSDPKAGAPGSVASGGGADPAGGQGWVPGRDEARVRALKSALLSLRSRK